MTTATGTDTIGSLIRSRRTELGRSQHQYAKDIGVSRITLRLWEADASRPNWKHLGMLSTVLEVSVASLLKASGIDLHGDGEPCADCHGLGLADTTSHAHQESVDE